MNLADKNFLILEILLLIGAAVSSVILTSSLQLFTVFSFPTSSALSWPGNTIKTMSGGNWQENC